MSRPLHRLIAIGFWLFVPVLLAQDELPKLAPLKGVPPSPAENPSTDAKIALGKELFFDTRLSGDNSISCATCHMPDKGFADALPTSKGFQGQRLTRNAQGLLNVGYYDSFFWDGRASTLEQQALVPIESAKEMHQPLDELEVELNQITGYRTQFQAVFETKVTRLGIAKALAAFQRSLRTEASPFDRYLAGDENAISELAKEGLELFRGGSDCIRCHHGPMLTDGKFYRLGVSFTDRGRGAVTGRSADDYKFRTPSLRNITLTGPYMHDGSIKTLDDVVMFYYRGVPSSSASRPLDVEPLIERSFSEMLAMVAFLETLTADDASDSNRGR